jgi:hypothetical protein
LRAAVEQERLRGLLGDNGVGSAELPSEPIGDHLLAILAYDWPDSVQSITAENLAGWGVTTYEAMEVARQNLAEATLGYARIGENLYAFTSGDTYDASRLTLTDRIQELEVAGKPVAMVPNRDALLITGSEDEVGLAMMAELAGKALQDSYVLNGVPLILEDGAWVNWLPPADHPLQRPFKEMETNWLGPLSFEQKKLLDAVHQRQGIDSFTASFSAI